jgi:exosome complex component RRP40
MVVGICIDRFYDSNSIDIGGPFPAVLPALAFEGATRRNRPNLNVGDLVYARVVSAPRDADPEIVCMDQTGRVLSFNRRSSGPKVIREMIDQSHAVFTLEYV